VDDPSRNLVGQAPELPACPGSESRRSAAVVEAHGQHACGGSRGRRTSHTGRNSWGRCPSSRSWPLRVDALAR